MYYHIELLSISINTVTIQEMLMVVWLILSLIIFKIPTYEDLEETQREDYLFLQPPPIRRGYADANISQS